jgi:hypothetical protein
VTFFDGISHERANLEEIMETSMGLTAYVIEGVAAFVNASLAALGWDLGIPRCNEDFVWH